MSDHFETPIKKSPAQEHTLPISILKMHKSTEKKKVRLDMTSVDSAPENQVASSGKRVTSKAHSLAEMYRKNAHTYKHGPSYRLKHHHKGQPRSKIAPSKQATVESFIEQNSALHSLSPIPFTDRDTDIDQRGGRGEKARARSTSRSRSRSRSPGANSSSPDRIKTAFGEVPVPTGLGIARKSMSPDKESTLTKHVHHRLVPDSSQQFHYSFKASMSPTRLDSHVHLKYLKLSRESKGLMYALFARMDFISEIKKAYQMRQFFDKWMNFNFWTMHRQKMREWSLKYDKMVSYYTQRVGEKDENGLMTSEHSHTLKVNQERQIELIHHGYSYFHTMAPIVKMMFFRKYWRQWTDELLEYRIEQDRLRLIEEGILQEQELEAEIERQRVEAQAEKERHEAEMREKGIRETEEQTKAREEEFLRQQELARKIRRNQLQGFDRILRIVQRRKDKEIGLNLRSMFFHWAINALHIKYREAYIRTVDPLRMHINYQESLLQQIETDINRELFDRAGPFKPTTVYSGIGERNTLKVAAMKIRNNTANNVYKNYLDINDDNDDDNEADGETKGDDKDVSFDDVMLLSMPSKAKKKKKSKRPISEEKQMSAEEHLYRSTTNAMELYEQTIHPHSYAEQKEREALHEEQMLEMSRALEPSFLHPKQRKNRMITSFWKPKQSSGIDYNDKDALYEASVLSNQRPNQQKLVEYYRERDSKNIDKAIEESKRNVQLSLSSPVKINDFSIHLNLDMDNLDKERRKAQHRDDSDDSEEGVEEEDDDEADAFSMDSEAFHAFSGRSKSTLKVLPVEAIPSSLEI